MADDDHAHEHDPAPDRASEPAPDHGSDPDTARTHAPDAAPDPAQAIRDGRAVLGIELGSTRIKAVLVDEHHRPIASGAHEWENELVDGRWTYPIDAVWDGLRAAYADLVRDTDDRYGVTPTTYRAMGISAMMHGYVAFDENQELLVPFRTWRNTSTGPAAAKLSEALGFNVPLRWSVAHLYQAVLDDEPHVPEIAGITTLAGYVHLALTGRNVLGVGDASGMFPIARTTKHTATYDPRMLDTAELLTGQPLHDLLPEVLVAGQDAGRLTPEGAHLLDPTGTLDPEIPLCPPEGDAGTGMVATNAVAPRTGNVSVGTSIFAMVVLERPLGTPHEELDVVTTPAGDAVAMVHCNNGMDELASWARVFGEFDPARSADEVYATLLDAATADADPDAGGLLAVGFLSGEPIAGVDEGRPLLLKTPGSRFTLGNLVRAEVHAAFATLAIGMEVLAEERVAVDRMTAHGGLFRTKGAAQRLLAAALDAPVAVQDTAGEGGAWGIALLAAYRADTADRTDADSSGSLDAYLTDTVFADAATEVAEPRPDDRAGFETFLARFRAALPIQHAAAEATPAPGEGRGGAAPSLQAEKETTR